MKDEIKEILECFSSPDINFSEMLFNRDERLLDYITNLQEELEDLRRIFGIWNNRKLINKFNKEYDKEDKNKNPNRNYVAIYPDAEEVYKRYYDYKSRNEKAIEYIKQLEKSEWITFGRKILLEILNGDDEE